MLLFILLLSAKSRSELIKTEEELVRAENTNEVGVGGEACLSSAEWAVCVQVPGAPLSGPDPSLAMKATCSWADAAISYVDVKGSETYYLEIQELRGS